MKNLFYIVFFVANNTVGQTDTFVVYNHQFVIETEIKKNDWDTKDTVNYLYRIVGDRDKYLLRFYSFKDEGGDCNNLFWNTETLLIKEDSLIFETIYHQKTGIDPIPEKRKQVFKVIENGFLVLVFDKYKMRGEGNWVSEY